MRLFATFIKLVKKPKCDKKNSYIFKILKHDTKRDRIKGKIPGASFEDSTQSNRGPKAQVAGSQME